MQEHLKNTIKSQEKLFSDYAQSEIKYFSHFSTLHSITALAETHLLHSRDEGLLIHWRVMITLCRKRRLIWFLEEKL